MSNCGSCGGCSKVKNTSVSREDLVEAFLNLLERKAEGLKDHGLKVGELAGFVASYLGIDQNTSDKIKVAASLHDIGMLYVPSDLLVKEGPLNEADWLKLKKHPSLGHDLFEDEEVAEMILYHHEAFDGTGYPEGLPGTQIPLGARIIGFCEAIVSMAQSHPYKEPMSLEEILEEVEAQKEQQFDPWLVNHAYEIVSHLFTRLL